LEPTPQDQEPQESRPAPGAGEASGSGHESGSTPPPSDATPDAVVPCAPRDRARDFVQALIAEDDFPESSVQVWDTCVIAVGITDEERDQVFAAILLSTARARFRDVLLGSQVDPEALAPSFERENAETVAAREKLFRILRTLEDEIAQAKSAAEWIPKTAPGARPAKEWLGHLQNVRSRVAQLHALCFANTLEDSYDRVMLQCVNRAERVARAVGLKV